MNKNIAAVLLIFSFSLPAGALADGHSLGENSGRAAG